MLRGHLAEHGVVAAQGPAHVKRLADALADDTLRLPTSVRELGHLLLEQIAALDQRIADLDRRLRNAAGQAETTKRLQTMPGVGPITAVAVETFAPAPPIESFAAAGTLRPGLALCRCNARPVANSGSERPRRWASATFAGAHHWSHDGGASRRALGAPEGSWLARMLARKPRMLVAIALANNTNRPDLDLRRYRGQLSVWDQPI